MNGMGLGPGEKKSEKGVSEDSASKMQGDFPARRSSGLKGTELSSESPGLDLSQTPERNHRRWPQCQFLREETHKYTRF